VRPAHTAEPGHSGALRRVLYFETDAGDGFREPGFSKERRLEPQITIGLLTDAAGFPLMVNAYPTVQLMRRRHDDFDRQMVQAVARLSRQCGLGRGTDAAALANDGGGHRDASISAPVEGRRRASGRTTVLRRAGGR
jgi:hypothetical protein